MPNNPAPSNADWLREVVERFEGPLVRYAQRLTGNVERARDVVQETFVRLCAETPARIGEHVAEWLFTVCRNRAVDVRRKEGRMAALGQSRLDQHESRDAGPAAVAEHRDAVSHVLRVLDTIPDNQQEVIRLKFQNGFSYREISRVTGLSESNVGFLIHTGLKTIRERIATKAATK